MSVLSLLAAEPATDYDGAPAEVRAYVRASADRPGVRLAGRVQHEDQHGLLLDVDVALPQRPEEGIHQRERVLLAWGANARNPIVYPARDDFPSTPHRVLGEPGDPLGLCLFDHPQQQLDRDLTPQALLDRVAHWLDQAAAGELFDDAQRLEPFVLGAASLACRQTLFEASDLHLVEIVGLRHPGVGLALTAGPARDGIMVSTEDAERAERRRDGSVAYTVVIEEHKRDGRCYLPLVLEGRPCETMCMQRSPASFADLAELLQGTGIDFNRAASQIVKRVMEENRFRLLAARWLFLLNLPKIRTGSTETRPERLAFALPDVTVEELGMALGVLAKSGDGLGLVLESAWNKEPPALGTPVPLSPHWVLTPERAHALAHETGRPFGDRVLCIGAGALGSQVVLNLTREGTAVWTLVDRDVLLPHNLGRHALAGSALGNTKVAALARTLQTVLDAPPESVEYLAADVLAEDQQERIATALASASAVLDFSADASVQRHLARGSDTTPRLTAFLHERGRRLVVLAEPASRTVRLDDLELALAAASVQENADPLLLVPSDEAAVRTGGGCADVSAVLPQSRVGLWSGLLAVFVSEWLRDPHAEVSVWRLADDQTVSRCRLLAPRPSTTAVSNGWTVRVAAGALDRLRDLRASRLPNETTGVLIGTLDVVEQTIHVADALDPPSDTVERPDHCVRGIRGLNRRLREVEERSGGILRYVGEWHTHPQSAAPSGTDDEALTTLGERFHQDGLPALQVIIGGSDDLRVRVAPLSSA